MLPGSTQVKSWRGLPEAELAIWKGLKGLLQHIPLLQQECIVFCVREEPVLFLHMDDDFMPYTPRGKENLHENLHSLQQGIKVENLELAIRKEVILNST